MSFELTILGSGAALPTSRRNPTAQYIVCNDRHILIDCGEGTQIQIRKAGIKLQRISHILISHLHGDHFFGLPGLLSTMHLMGRNQGITIYGPQELENILKQTLFVGQTKLSFELHFVPLNGKESKLIFEDRLIEIHTFPLRHRIPTNGFKIIEKDKERPLDVIRVEKDNIPVKYWHLFKKGMNVMDDSGKELKYKDYTLNPVIPASYAYCSDTIYDEKIIEFVSKSTVLYHEATFMEKDIDRAKATFHTTAKQAAQIAKLAQVKTLYLGHISARYDRAELLAIEAREIFENAFVVEDGQKFIIR